MSTKPTLVNPTNNQISAAVSEFVAAWKLVGFTGTGYPPPEAGTLRSNCRRTVIPPFATSANAVLPLLEKWHVEISHLLTGGWLVLLRGSAVSKSYYRHTSLHFSLAASVALLRAHGVTVTFTNPTREDKA